MKHELEITKYCCTFASWIANVPHGLPIKKLYSCITNEIYLAFLITECKKMLNEMLFILCNKAYYTFWKFFFFWSVEQTLKLKSILYFRKKWYIFSVVEISRDATMCFCLSHLNEIKWKFGKKDWTRLDLNQLKKL